MAYGNLAYRLDTYPEQQPRQGRRPEVRAYRPGQSQEVKAAPSILSTLGKMVAIFIVVVAALSFVRIMLTNQTVTTMLESDALSAQISEARSTGTSLEMEQSVLSNSNAVKVQAKRLGMTAPATTSTINLTPDVVAINNGDTLSLSDTIKNVVEIQE